MLARSDTIIKWILYALAGLVWAVVQAAVLQRFTFWDVIPFLYPLIAAIPATFEGPTAGTVYALPAYLLTGVFHCIVLWATGHAAWTAGMSVTLRELCASLLWSLPMTWLFRKVFLRVHIDD